MWDDLRHAPATLTLGALWLLLFIMMQVRQGSFESTPNLFTFGAVEVATTHEFGDATSAELKAGQLWRAITSTCVHYCVLHLALNLFGLWQLGLIVEQWYGSALFLAIYVLIGGLGNLFAGFTRTWVERSATIPFVHCAGGSTVVFGLIGLCAVVGWKSRKPEGRELSWLMIFYLLLNLGIGLAFWAFKSSMGLRIPNFDNMAHLGGTAVGVAIGLAHRPLTRYAERPLASWAAVLGALVLVVSSGAQARANWAEAEAADRLALANEQRQDAEVRLTSLAKLEQLYLFAYYRGRVPWTFPASPGVPLLNVGRNRVVALPETAEIQRELKQALDRLESISPVFGTPSTPRGYRRVLALGRKAIDKPPTRLQVQEFQSYLAQVLPQAQLELAAAKVRLIALGKPTRR